MTSLDPFTYASRPFLEATRHRFREGCAFEIRKAGLWRALSDTARGHLIAALAGGILGVIAGLLVH